MLLLSGCYFLACCGFTTGWSSFHRLLYIHDIIRAMQTLEQTPSLAIEYVSEKHATQITQLKAFIDALLNYVPGAPGSCSVLQEAMQPLKIPANVNQRNALEWATLEIQSHEQAMALELAKENAFRELQTAERARRTAERTAVKARKRWTQLQTIAPTKSVAVVRAVAHA